MSCLSTENLAFIENTHWRWWRIKKKNLNIQFIKYGIWIYLFQKKSLIQGTYGDILVYAAGKPDAHPISVPNDTTPTWEERW